MTIQFNLMEHALELLIAFILGTDGSGLTSPLIRRMHFGTKVDVLKEQVGALGEQSAPTAETQEAYQRFASEVKNLISQAKQLNTFRNSVIHWRPFLAGSAPRPESEVSAEQPAQATAWVN